MKKFAFYVSDNATRLKRFLRTYGDAINIKNIEFIIIDNDKNTELSALCESLKVKLYNIDVSLKHNKNECISTLFLKYLNKHNVDYGFVFGTKILAGELLDRYKNKLINFHPSLLPSYKGLNSIDKALIANSLLLGNSAHIITNELDSGTVIMQNIFPAVKFKHYDDVLDNQIPMLHQLMIWLNEERVTIESNGYVLVKNASYGIGDFVPNLEFIAE